MKRTTIMADEELLLEAAHLARQQGRSLSAIVSEALRAYLAAQRPARRISCAGIVNVPMSLSAAQMDRDLIDGLDPIEGWSPDRSGLVETESGERRVP
jgi:metal-responsive CopG/Arc/MetJ family transcriptional regulator